MEGPLGKRIDALPPKDVVTDDEILDAFLAYVADEGLSLYPAQEEAILELYAGKNVILNTPTGSGKSLVALALHFRALARGQKAYYTSPIKALASEKFFHVARELSPDWVGMMTGDATIHREASIICATAEILSNIALREGKDADVDYVVMDEFHFYSDRERGVAWQVPLLTLPQSQFLLMSATLGPTAIFEETLTKTTGRETVVVRSATRPVPLDYSYRETPLHETIADLLAENRAPIYLVNFSQRSAAEEAQNLMSIDVCTKEEKKKIAELLVGARFDTPYGKEISKFIRHGIGIHHAGLLPKYRLIVELLAQKGLLKVISGTDTLGVGVNVPIRTVLFTKLCKFDGVGTKILSAREFHQIAGRAGRKGFDDRGSVVAQAPEHVIENLRLEAKILADPSKKKKIVKRKPPERGYVPWDKNTFEKLSAAQPEALLSRFKVTHGMLLDVLLRETGTGGCKAMARLIWGSHESRRDKRAHGRAARDMFHALVEADVLQVKGREVSLREGLQRDFSMRGALSLYLFDTWPKVADLSSTYALDLLSLIEATLEDPGIVLDRQADKLKTEKMAELKAAGVPFEERVAELEKISYPKPLSEFVYDTYNAFVRLYPWTAEENVRPKAVAREFVEQFAGFNDYVREYGLERSEGVLLRYLSDVVRTLEQTIPPEAKTEEVKEAELFLGALVRQVDSSLLDEWERMRQARDAMTVHAATAEAAEAALAPSDVTRDMKAFRVLVRNAVFSILRAAARRDYADCAAQVVRGPGSAFGELEFREGFERFYAAHAEEPTLHTGPAARAPSLLTLDETDDPWACVQTLVDPKEENDWYFKFQVDLAQSRELGRPAIVPIEIGT
ncbi:MAG: DUF3516 domain-containing protein [Polyangiaceae bacterium]